VDKSDFQNISCSDQPISPTNISSPHNTLNDYQKILILQAVAAFFDEWINDLTDLADIPAEIKLSELEKIQQIIDTIQSSGNTKYPNSEYAGTINSGGLKTLEEKINSLITSPEKILKNSLSQIKITNSNKPHFKQIVLNHLTELLNHAIQNKKQLVESSLKEDPLFINVINKNQALNRPISHFSESDASSISMVQKAYATGVANAKMDQNSTSQLEKQLNDTAEIMKNLDKMYEGISTVSGKHQAQHKQINQLEKEKEELEEINNQLTKENVFLYIQVVFSSWLQKLENLHLPKNREILDLNKISQSVRIPSIGGLNADDSSNDESDDSKSETLCSKEAYQQESCLLQEMQDLIKSPQNFLPNTSIIRADSDYCRHEILSFLEQLIADQIETVANNKMQNQSTSDTSTLEATQQNYSKQNYTKQEIREILLQIAKLTEKNTEKDDNYKVLYATLERAKKENLDLKTENETLLQKCQRVEAENIQLKEYIKKNANPLIRDADALVDKEPPEDKDLLENWRTILKTMIGNLLNALNEKKIGKNSPLERAGIKLLLGQLYLKQINYLEAQKYFKDNEVIAFFETLASEGLIYTYIGQVWELLEHQANGPLPNLDNLLNPARQILAKEANHFDENQQQVLTKLVEFVASLPSLINGVHEYNENLEERVHGCFPWLFCKNYQERKFQVGEIFNIILTYFFNPYLVVEKLIAMSEKAHRGPLGKSSLFDKIHENLQNSAAINSQRTINEKLTEVKNSRRFFNRKIQKGIESTIPFSLPENSEPNSSI
jgi:hypothetical protein